MTKAGFILKIGGIKVSYKGEIEEQSFHSIEELEEKIERIENWFTDDVAKCFSGRTIYVLDPDIFDGNYFVNTTISDVEDLCGTININFLNYENKLIVHTIRKPKKKEWSGVLKFTPPKSYVYEMSIVFDKGKGLERYKVPIIQNEKFITEKCKEYFDNDDVNADYDYVMKHAFSDLLSDKRFSLKKDFWQYEEEKERCSHVCHELVCQYYDIKKSWAITYVFKNVLFVIPMKQEYFKQIFKDRDIADGKKRRGVLPTIINEHTRGEKGIVHSHLRSSGDYVTIHGRDFSFVLNDLDRIYPETDYAKKKLVSDYKKSHKEDNMYVIGESGSEKQI